MEAVKAFNAEMASVMDLKPPISRAKMMSITKAGLKAIKLYKHVVQIIEKFINKCNPELKVPGLYVMDSIIRQSRLQYGEDKDVFGPRFLKNVTVTFQGLYQCPPDDKEKILRVLNLWQKNSVFSMDIIQPLLDMASAPAAQTPENGHAQGGSPAAVVCVEPTAEPAMPCEPQRAVEPFQNDAALAAVSRFLQSSQDINIEQILQTLQQVGPTKSNTFNSTSVISAQENTVVSEFCREPEMLQQRLEGTPQSSMSLPDSSQVLQTQMFNQLPEQLPPAVQMEEQITATTFEDTHGTGTTRDRLAESSHDKRSERDMRYRTRTRSRSPRRRSSSHSRSNARRSRFHRSHSRERHRTSPRSDREDRKDVERRRNGLPPLKKQTLSVCSTTLWIGQLDKKIQQQDINGLMEEFGQIQSINMIPPRGCAYVVMVLRLDAYMALNKLSRSGAKINHKPFKIAWAMNKGVSSRFKKYWDAELGVTYVPWDKLKESETAALQEGGMLDKETIKPEWAALLAELGMLPEVNKEAPKKEQEDGTAVAQQVPDLSTGSDIPNSNHLPVHHMTFNEEPKNQNGLSSFQDPQPCFINSMMPVPNLPSNPLLADLPPQNQPSTNLPPYNFPSAALTTPSMHSAKLPSNSPPPGHLSPEKLSLGNLPLHNVPSAELPIQKLLSVEIPSNDLPSDDLPPASLPLPRLPSSADVPPDFPPLDLPPVNRPPADLAWPNLPRPNLPRPNLPHPTLFPPNFPRPGLPPSNMSLPGLPRGSVFMHRMPIRGPGSFPPSQPMGPDHWEGKDFNNDWQEDGPSRGPQWFGSQPPFRHPGWNRGGPRGRAWFRN